MTQPTERCAHLDQVRDASAEHAHGKHFHSTKHAIMKSCQPGVDWSWCYVDELFMEPAARPAS